MRIDLTFRNSLSLSPDGQDGIAVIETSDGCLHVYKEEHGRITHHILPPRDPSQPLDPDDQRPPF